MAMVRAHTPASGNGWPVRHKPESTVMKAIDKQAAANGRVTRLSRNPIVAAGIHQAPVV